MSDGSTKGVKGPASPPPPPPPSSGAASSGPPPYDPGLKDQSGTISSPSIAPFARLVGDSQYSLTNDVRAAYVTKLLENTAAYMQARGFTYWADWMPLDPSDSALVIERDDQGVIQKVTGRAEDGGIPIEYIISDEQDAIGVGHDRDDIEGYLLQALEEMGEGDLAGAIKLIDKAGEMFAASNRGISDGRSLVGALRSNGVPPTTSIFDESPDEEMLYDNERAQDARRHIQGRIPGEEERVVRAILYAVTVALIRQRIDRDFEGRDRLAAFRSISRLTDKILAATTNTMGDYRVFRDWAESMGGEAREVLGSGPTVDVVSVVPQSSQYHQLDAARLIDFASYVWDDEAVQDFMGYRMLLEEALQAIKRWSFSRVRSVATELDATSIAYHTPQLEGEALGFRKGLHELMRAHLYYMGSLMVVDYSTGRLYQQRAVDIAKEAAIVQAGSLAKRFLLDRMQRGEKALGVTDTGFKTMLDELDPEGLDITGQIYSEFGKHMVKGAATALAAMRVGGKTDEYAEGRIAKNIGSWTMKGKMKSLAKALADAGADGVLDDFRIILSAHLSKVFRANRMDMLKGMNSHVLAEGLLRSDHSGGWKAIRSLLWENAVHDYSELVAARFIAAPNDMTDILVTSNCALFAAGEAVSILSAYDYASPLVENAQWLQGQIQNRVSVLERGGIHLPAPGGVLAPLFTPVAVAR